MLEGREWQLNIINVQPARKKLLFKMMKTNQSAVGNQWRKYQGTFAFNQIMQNILAQCVTKNPVMIFVV